MGKQWMNFVWFSLVLVGIILSSVVFGGYSSLHRAEGRIDITKELFLNACQSRLDLLPPLLDFLKENEATEMLAKLKQTGQEAGIVLRHAISRKSSLSHPATRKLEISQTALTKELVKIFLALDQSKSKQNIESFKTIKEQFFSAQNKLFVERTKYNTEVRYFNRRTKIFPGYIIAKLFGFDKSEYFELSQDLFLGADRTFGVQG